MLLIFVSHMHIFFLLSMVYRVLSNYFIIVSLQPFFNGTKQDTSGEAYFLCCGIKPIKAPESVSTIITAESIFYKGVYYQIGDVVSVIDEQDGKPYYAQIRGFIQDQYCEKSAALTWLIPTLSSPRDQFDPASYIIGPEEDLPRKMEYLEFVCHAPSEYFKSRSSPFPTVPTRPEKGYIWTHVGPTPAITIKESVANHL
eukprot:XP_024302618.1 GATA zinc finger domain-containing protein 1 isoform X1 [Homo sapiens]